MAFALVYVFWGSTYLGIGIAVEHIPPALMCAIRFLISGRWMLLYCALRAVKFAFTKAVGANKRRRVLLLVGVI